MRWLAEIMILKHNEIVIHIGFGIYDLFTYSFVIFALVDFILR